MPAIAAQAIATPEGAAAVQLTRVRALGWARFALLVWVLRWNAVARIWSGVASGSRSPAICWLSRPTAARSRISRSREVSGGNGGPGG